MSTIADTIGARSPVSDFFSPALSRFTPTDGCDCGPTLTADEFASSAGSSGSESSSSSSSLGRCVTLTPGALVSAASRTCSRDPTERVRARVAMRYIRHAGVSNRSQLHSLKAEFSPATSQDFIEISPHGATTPKVAPVNTCSTAAPTLARGEVRHWDSPRVPNFPLPTPCAAVSSEKRRRCARVNASDADTHDASGTGQVAPTVLSVCSQSLPHDQAAASAFSG